MKRMIIVGMGLLALMGCQDKDMSSISETAGLQSQKQIELENQNRIQRALEMEGDLANRHRFYQGVRGIYEGAFQAENTTYRVRLTLIPSVPPYPNGRTRTLEEISYDLSNLHFSVQIVQWNPAHPMSAVGCRVEGVRPDLATGEMSIASENCPNVYMLSLSDPAGARMGSGESSDSKVDQTSRQVASSLLEGKQTAAEAIVGKIQPTTNAAIYSFSATRVK
jgi:hypothetical protein